MSKMAILPTLSTHGGNVAPRLSSPPGYSPTKDNFDSECFKPSQPQISGLRETSIKRYTVERATVAEIRPEEENEKAESCQENLWNEIQLKRT